MRVVDTLSLARRKHPGAPNNLDALCARYGIDNSRRTKHGALLDAEILAEVYIELIGGKQADLGLTRAPRAVRRPSSGVAAGGAQRRVAISRGSPTPSAPPTRLRRDASAPTAIWRDYVVIGRIAGTPGLERICGPRTGGLPRRRGSAGGRRAPTAGRLPAPCSVAFWR